jgi:hypothetical protein
LVAVQPERYISVVLRTGRKVVVVPTIGVPRAELYQRIDSAIRKLAPTTKDMWLLYDERGILKEWLGHLAWLDGHLPVRSVQVSNADDQLRGHVL